MYILQETLFSFEEWLKIESGNRLPLFFSTLNLEPYTKELKSTSPRGADGYDRQAVLRALLAAPMEKISTFTMLHQRLQSDIRFRYQCGFRLTERVPSISTFSRVFSKITEKNLAEQLFYDLVQGCRDEGIIIGDKIAIVVPPLMPSKKNNLNPGVRILSMPHGALNLTVLATKLPGLAIKSIWQLIQQANCRLH